MKTTTRILLLLLVAALFVGTLTACTGNNPPVNTTEATTESTETTTETAEPAVPLRELPQKKYDTNVVFMMRYNGSQTDIFVDENSTDAIEQLVWERNETVQNQYGLELEFSRSTDFDGYAATTQILAGDRFDVIVPHGRFGALYAQQGCLVDLYNLPYLNLSYDWWSQNMVQNFTINNKLYFATGDISWQTTYATYCLLYNRDIIADIENATTPYQYVKADNWNWSTFSALAKQCVRDMDGDGFSTIDSSTDILGWTTYPYGGTYCTFYASNNLILKTNDLGMPYFALATESAYNAMVNHFDLLNGDGFQLADDDNDTRMELATRANRVAFRDTTLSNIVAQYRTTSLNYGFVPFPKVDTTMDHYTGHVAGSTNMFMVSRTCGNFEATAVALEALAQEGSKTVIPAYREFASVRGSRDQENYEMIPLIVAAQVFDLGYYWSPLSTLSSYFQYLALQHSADTFYSKYQSYVDNGEAQKRLNELMSLFS